MNGDFEFDRTEEDFISLFIKTKKSFENKNTLDAFKLFCEREAKNDYTFGLRLLLNNLDYVHSMNALWSRYEEVDDRVSSLERVPFGGLVSSSGMNFKEDNKMTLEGDE